jgi:hypothetical protein
VTSVSIIGVDALWQELRLANDDGNVSDPECLNDACVGECELNEKDDGSTIEYWCECKPQ